MRISRRTTAALLLQGDRGARARRSRGEKKKQEKTKGSTPHVRELAPSKRQSLSRVAERKKRKEKQMRAHVPCDVID